MSRDASAILVALILSVVVSQISSADTVTIVADRDTTLFEHPQGGKGGGAGVFLYSGKTGPDDGGGRIKRGLLRFDLAGSSLPDDAVITAVTLTLTVTKTPPGQAEYDFSLHRVTKDWGEGSSAANWGYGESATEGDATWLHTFYDSIFWTNTGGDFNAEPRASQSVAGPGKYTWSSTPEMIADVLAWLENPQANFGWLLKGDETILLTARQFAARENENPDNRPTLTIEYTPGSTTQPEGIIAAKDNTLFEHPEGAKSGGAGAFLYAGKTGEEDGGGRIKRALLWFDIAASGIPSGATITDAALTLTVNRTPPGAAPYHFTLHRLKQDWGEGSSAADWGYGEPATPGDATWLHTFFDTQFWTAPGGDFETTPSVGQSVGDVGKYTWGSTKKMVADVQAWLDNPQENFGWLLKGDETTLLTARQFVSRENENSNDRPVLIVGYELDSSTLLDDPLIRMPGTQPGHGVNLENSATCMKCHADYDQQAEPGFNWTGSMMSQAARDPIFWACFTVSLQDSVWALGTPNAGDLCERCHFPAGWLAGRSDPPNASAMRGPDYDAIGCDFCHRMYDPFFEATFNGDREGNDWIGYWDEAANTGPASGTDSQTQAAKTYLADRAFAAEIRLFSGEDFYTKFNVPKFPTYDENTSGQYFVSANPEKRAGFADAPARHEKLYSRYHKSKYFCGTCHDVSNPVLANLGLSELPDLSGGSDLITEQYAGAAYFHVERTFSEFMLSAYGRQGGAATNPDFKQLSGIEHAAKCQDCHLADVTGYGCNKTDAPLRPDESAEHPNSGVPMHDMTGGNAWISHILASADPNGPVYDPVNAQILGKGPDVLTLDMTAGLSPAVNGNAMKAGSDRAKQQLRLAASIKNLQYDKCTGSLSFAIQNNTAHKLISGFPEGRRMFVNIKAFAEQKLIHEINPYDYSVGTLKGLPNSSASPAPTDNEAYVDELVYEIHPKSDLTGENHTFHFVLATGRFKDNRIPPKGFDFENAKDRFCLPVWNGQSALDYFTGAEYADGYDQIGLQIPPGADEVSVTVYYQGTSREYVAFLKSEINGSGGTLAAPTPSGNPEAYIIQSDPFFAQLRQWGNAIWNLWHHNHGLDGSGVAVEGIVPFEMTTATWRQESGSPTVDFAPNGRIDFEDFALFAQRWLSPDCTPCCRGDLTGDQSVDFNDLRTFLEYWLATSQP